MVAAIRSYMEDKTTAFQLDEALAEVVVATGDETVADVGQALWFHYDDLKDHKIVASKEQWDYLSRLLLLLESDAEVEVVRGPRRWHFRQAAAGSCLLAFAFLAFRTGFGEHLFAYAVPFGAVSMLLAWLASRERAAQDRSDPTTIPFPSVRSLFSVRRRVPGFRKARYPKAIASRRIRRPLLDVWICTDKIMWLPLAMVWLLLSPVPLFFQTLPDRETETTIRMPEPEGAGDASSVDA